LYAAQELTPGLTIQLQHLEHFRPGRPTPTHRDQSPALS